MNFLKISFLFFLVLGMALSSCKKDEPTTIEATDFTGSFASATVLAWVNGSVIGTVTATTNNGSLNYTLISQNIAGIIAINATTGQITVANKTAFNNNAICVGSNSSDGLITGVVKVTNGSVTRDINVRITLVNWCN